MNRHTAGVTWQDARAIALQWIADALKDADRHAKILLMPDFVSDEDCDFFIPGRPLAFHRMILKAAARDARRRGIKVVMHKIAPEQYRQECQLLKLADTPEHRAHFLFRQTKPVVT